MRLKLGIFIASTGLAIAGVGAVPAALGAPIVAWIMVIGGVVLAIAGLVHAMRGETPDERHRREHKDTLERHALQNEREGLTARLVEIQGTKGIREYWATVAADYGDKQRGDALAGELATLTAERDRINRRLMQIDQELDE